MPLKPDIARALGYPYPAPTDDFVLRAGVAESFDSSVSLTDRTPVLAVGSNRAPEQLRRKFGDAAVVPVTVARLADHDVVYSAHVASYGSIPATLAPSPGSVVTVSLTWLTPAQLHHMHKTEAVGVNYDYAVAEILPIQSGPIEPGPVESGPIESGAERPSGPIGCYLGRRGAVAFDGAPLALTEIHATNRRFQSLSQSEILARVHAKVAGPKKFTDWLAGLIEDRGARQGLTETLTALYSQPINLPAFRIRNEDLLNPNDTGNDEGAS
ncbi:MAG: hypothetical protein O2985_05835 [Proteobacteria bacterium]|nr:hypothetical protein [Pseudomonadota bacterium]